MSIGDRLTNNLSKATFIILKDVFMLWHMINFEATWTVLEASLVPDLTV